MAPRTRQNTSQRLRRHGVDTLRRQGADLVRAQVPPRHTADVAQGRVDIPEPRSRQQALRGNPPEAPRQVREDLDLQRIHGGKVHVPPFPGDNRRTRREGYDRGHTEPGAGAEHGKGSTGPRRALSKLFPLGSRERCHRVGGGLQIVDHRQCVEPETICDTPPIQGPGIVGKADDVMRHRTRHRQAGGLRHRIPALPGSHVREIGLQDGPEVRVIIDAIAAQIEGHRRAGLRYGKARVATADIGNQVPGGGG
jgi:hypothetical protein